MRIAIASDDGKHIASYLGRAAAFVIVDIEEKAVTTLAYRPNTFTGHTTGEGQAPHEHHGHGSLLSALKDCQVIISHGMGRRLYEDLCRLSGFHNRSNRGGDRA